MCGIAGAFSKRGVKLSEFLYVLQGLQHRGQESTGFVGYSIDGEFITFKTLGLVHQVMDKFGKDPYMRIIIGHTRYSTQGESWRQENIQPFYILEEGGTIAVVHNGNIINYGDLKTNLNQGVYFSNPHRTPRFCFIFTFYRIKASLTSSNI